MVSQHQQPLIPLLSSSSSWKQAPRLNRIRTQAAVKDQSSLLLFCPPKKCRFINCLRIFIVSISESATQFHAAVMGGYGALVNKMIPKQTNKQTDREKYHMVLFPLWHFEALNSGGSQCYCSSKGSVSEKSTERSWQGVCIINNECIFIKAISAMTLYSTHILMQTTILGGFIRPSGRYCSLPGTARSIMSV